MSASPTRQRRLSPQAIMAKKFKHEKIVSLTAYDYGTAKLMDETGVVDFILVGDSLAMVVLGHPDTLSVTMDEMLHHVKAVSRGVSRAMVVADMPFISVHVDLASGVLNAARMIQEGRADAIKLEGASPLTLSLVKHLVGIGIPVMGHLGFTPQSVNAFGGFKLQGKTMPAIEALVRDARALENAGAFAVVLEMVPAEVARMITQLLNIPTIGIGAGAGCDGQILVSDDFIGKFPDFRPKFARPYMDFAPQLQQAVRHYAMDIQSGLFPDAGTESFHLPAELTDRLQAFEAEMIISPPGKTTVSLTAPWPPGAPV